MLEWTIPRKSYGEYHADIYFQGGIRYDYNELDTGAGGTEISGGVRLAGPIFRAHGSGRMFIHPDYREWGIQGLLELRSRQENGLGLKVSPTYGNAQSGVNQLWENGVTSNATHAQDMSGFVSAVLEYRNKYAPYSRVNIRGKQTDFQAGLGFRFFRILDMKLEAAYSNDKPGLSLRAGSSH